jgi:hypothetical protein
MAEMARRLQRLEDRMDARLLTIDVFEAREAAHQIEYAGIAHRLNQLEGAVSAATRLLIAAFLAIIGQAVFLLISIFGGR